MIPKIIHQIWFGSNPIDARCVEWSKTFDMPGFEHRIWKIQDIYALPDAIIAIMLADNIHWIFKVDIARYAILRQFGGFYADMDMECLRPFNELCDRDFICVKQNAVEITNCFMGCSIGNELMGHICLKAMDNLSGLKNKKSKRRVLETTGPYMLTNECVGQHPFSPEYFCPIWKGRGAPTEKTYCVHHYTRLWKK